MAGRIKHMERSRRSHHKNKGAIFSNFNRHAYSVEYAKQQRLSFGQMLAKHLAPIKNALKKAVD